jgi:UDP-N-acetylmuramate dehydrogenase
MMTAARPTLQRMTELAPLTTIRLGGAAKRLVEAHNEAEAIESVREAEATGEPVLVLAGGSNVVIADEGFPGTVVRLLTSGVTRHGDSELEVQAGEPWDPLVESAVTEGLAGIECLSGIPGSVGATPIQNVGAYGQEVSDTITRVRVYDRRAQQVEELAPDECEFTYRSSAFKRNPGRRLVLSVTFALHRDRESRPIRYAELARKLDVALGDTAPLAEVREAVLELRRGKGMVIDRDDPDTVSVGSFFTNPILSPEEIDEIARRAGVRPPAFPEPDGRVKTSAAWLVERAGFERGYGLPGPAAISTKHTLALTNRGGATTAQLLALAHEVADGVERELGVRLVPEPVLVGAEWRATSSRP